MIGHTWKPRETEPCDSSKFSEARDRVQTLRLAPRPYWPQRLLHIGSMTSRERRNGNDYSDELPDKEPAYATFSYTWGRFESSAGDALSIANVDWEIPRIVPGHFAADEFQHIIYEIASVAAVRYLWLDVACISQNDRSLLSEEVGRQRDIFHNSTLGFVWLSTFEYDELSNLFDELEDISEDVVEHSVPTLPHGGLGQMLRLEYQNRFRSATNLVARLVNDPWFSSLWTLQEAFANPDAIIMSKRGIMTKEPRTTPNIVQAHVLEIVCVAHTIQYTRTLEDFPSVEKAHEVAAPANQQHVTLRWLMTVSRRIHGVLLVLDHSTISADNQKKLQHLQLLIEAQGLSAFDSVNYNKVFDLARFRHQARPGDRVHGVAHVYGISASGLTRYASNAILDARAVAELAYSFGCALLQNHVVLSQLFVHREAAELDRSWRINNCCLVPEFDLYFDSYGSHILLCTLTVPDSSSDCFHGIACDLKPLLERWLDSDLAPDYADSSSLTVGSLVGLILDESYVILRDLSITRVPLSINLPRRHHDDLSHRARWSVSPKELANCLQKYSHLFLKEDVRVLWLGIALNTPLIAIGLVTLRQLNSHQGDCRERWKRIGLVFWVCPNMPPLSPSDNTLEDQIRWTSLYGRLG